MEQGDVVKSETQFFVMPADNQHVQQVVQAAERELRVLLQQRADTMKRIGTIKQTLAGLARIFGESVLPPDLLRQLADGSPRKKPGLTRACRVVLMESGSPIEVRRGCVELRKRFPEVLARHKNPLASVTTVFSRLVDYGEARSFISENGRRVWEWVADPTAINIPRIDIPHAESEVAGQC